MTDSAEKMGVAETVDYAPPPDPLIGKTVDGRYTIEGKLGEGGMGVVYRARHAVLKKLFAFKVLRAEVSRNPEILSRFKQEAQSASAIGNEHIIDISDFGVLADGATYFVMEYLDGQALAKLIEGGKFLAPERWIRIAQQLTRALGAAHDQGIVHRDLKPDNIYLIERAAQKDFVKVLDFGIAKVDKATSQLTRAGQVVGTPHYMSPEQCAGKPVDLRTDVYSLGVIMYEMACGRVPFDADTLMGILSKQVYEPPPSFAAVAPQSQISPEIEAVIMACLSKSPGDRYSTMAALGEDLERIAQGKMPRAKLGKVGDGAPVIESSPPARDAVRNTWDESVSPSKKGKSSLWLGVGVFALLGAGGWFFYGSRDAENPTRQSSKASAVVPSVRAPAQEGASTKTAALLKIRVNSVPSSASVLREGTWIGATPMEIERPAPGQTLRIELQKEGFQSTPLELSESTSDVIEIPLKSATQIQTAPADEPKIRPSKRSRTRGPADNSGGGKTKPRPSGGDLADPWS